MEYIGILATDTEVQKQANDTLKNSVFINKQNEIQYHIKALSESAPHRLYTGYMDSIFDSRQFDDVFKETSYSDESRKQEFRQYISDYVFVFTAKPTTIRDNGEKYNKIAMAKLMKKPIMKENDYYISVPVFSPKITTENWEYEHIRLNRLYNSYDEFIQIINDGRTIGKVSNYEDSGHHNFIVWYDGEKLSAIGPLTNIDLTSSECFIIRFDELYEIDISEYNKYFILCDDINPSIIHIPETVYEEIRNKFVTHTDTLPINVKTPQTVIHEPNDVISIEPSQKNDYELLKSFSQICEENDLYFESKDLCNLHTSLKTGSLVILAGMSGTGKSAIIDMYTRALGIRQDINEPRVLSIPVRPSWNDDSDLLGYVDLVHMVYRASDTGFVKLVVEASKPENRNNLYFVCFDEMNLARVEHYFSQFLSILEKPKGSRYLRLYDEQYQGRLYNSFEYPDIIEIGNNIRFIGTVNIDESTYNFADKVLDRSNVITLHILPFNSWKKQKYTTKLIQEWTRDDYDNISHTQSKNSYSDLRNLLWDMHNLLQKISVSIGIGPRVVKSIELFLNNLPSDAENFQITLSEGIDLQIKQRVLTKLRGSSEQCEALFNNDDLTLEKLFDKYSFLSDFKECRNVLEQKKKELKIYGYCI